MQYILWMHVANGSMTSYHFLSKVKSAISLFLEAFLMNKNTIHPFHLANTVLII